jgi:hypothetical protein
MYFESSFSGTVNQYMGEACIKVGDLRIVSRRDAQRESNVRIGRIYSSSEIDEIVHSGEATRNVPILIKVLEIGGGSSHLSTRYLNDIMNDLPIILNTKTHKESDSIKYIGRMKVSFSGHIFDILRWRDVSLEEERYYRMIRETLITKRILNRPERLDAYYKVLKSSTDLLHEGQIVKYKGSERLQGITLLNFQVESSPIIQIVSDDMLFYYSPCQECLQKEFYAQTAYLKKVGTKGVKLGENLSTSANQNVKVNPKVGTKEFINMFEELSKMETKAKSHHAHINMTSEEYYKHMHMGIFPQASTPKAVKSRLVTPEEAFALADKSLIQEMLDFKTVSKKEDDKTTKIKLKKPHKFKAETDEEVKLNTNKIIKKK